MPSFPPSWVGDIVLYETPARRKFPKNGKREYTKHILAKVSECNRAGLVMVVDLCLESELPKPITDKDKVAVLFIPPWQKKLLMSRFVGESFDSEREFINAAQYFLSLSGVKNETQGIKR